MTDEPQATDNAPTDSDLDLKATLLCALAHTTDTIKARSIKAEDLLRLSYGEQCAVVADLAPRANRTTPLKAVALFGTPAVRVRALAADVLDAAIRRRFAHTTADLTRASAKAPTDALFEILLEQGRTMRRETTRRTALTAGPTHGEGEQE